MIRALWAEWKKVQWWLVGILAIVGPGLSTLAGRAALEYNPGGMDEWLWMYSMTVQYYCWLFFPVMVGIFAALVCRYEHIGGGWKHLVSLPVSRTQIYLAKGITVFFCAGICQALLLIFFVGMARVSGLEGEIPWEMLVKGILKGLIAVLPLMALQLWVSFLWRSFGIPLAVNIVMALPSIFASQSEQIGPYYPWSQPFIAMMSGESSIPMETLLYVIIGGFLIAGIGGWQHFVRRDVTE